MLSLFIMFVMVGFAIETILLGVKRPTSAIAFLIRVLLFSTFLYLAYKSYVTFTLYKGVVL